MALKMLSKCPMGELRQRIGAVGLGFGLAMSGSIGVRGESNFYVATNGNDAWSGLLPAANPNATDGPFASLERARDAIRALKQHGPLTNGAIRVWLEDGNYMRQTTFALDYRDSGTPNSPIVYCAYSNATPRLVGGINVTGFNSISDPLILARLTASAQTNVLQAALWGQGITNLGVLTRHGYVIYNWGGQSELLFQHHPMQLARWPNTNWLTIAASPPPGTNSFAYVGARPAAWADLSDIWVHGYWRRDWADSCEKVASLDLSNNVAYIASPGSIYGYGPGQRFYFLNVLEELDSPGEYYIDRTNGVLYFWPPSEITNGSALISTLDYMVTLSSVAYTVLKGITFEGCKTTLVTIYGGISNLLDHCTLIGSARDGFLTANSWGTGVRDCNISDIGEIGLSFTGGIRTNLVTGANFAYGNIIHDVNRLSWTFKPAIYLLGVGHHIAHNRIYNATHSGIFMNGNDNVVEYNEIFNVCTETADAGAIYMGGDWTQRGNVFRYNYFHDVNKGGGAQDPMGVSGIYFDEGISGSIVLGNVFNSVQSGVVLGGGRDTLIQNNIFVDCAQCSVRADQRFTSWESAALLDGSTMMTKLNAMPYQDTTWSNRYPTLANIWNDEPAKAKGNVIQQNIRYNGYEWLRLFDQIETVLTVTNNFTSGDPQFVDYAHRNFNLSTNSPAWAIGFQAVPMNRFGPVPVSAQRLEVLGSQ